MSVAMQNRVHGGGWPEYEEGVGPVQANQCCWQLSSIWSVMLDPRVFWRPVVPESGAPLARYGSTSTQCHALLSQLCPIAQHQEAEHGVHG